MWYTRKIMIYVSCVKVKNGNVYYLYFVQIKIESFIYHFLYLLFFISCFFLFFWKYRLLYSSACRNVLNLVRIAALFACNLCILIANSCNTFQIPGTLGQVSPYFTFVSTFRLVLSLLTYVTEIYDFFVKKISFIIKNIIFIE